MTGVRDLLARQPTNDHVNQGAVLACLRGDRVLTKEILISPHFEYSDVFWHQIGPEVKVYPICRQWAAQVSDASDDQNQKAVPITKH